MSVNEIDASLIVKAGAELLTTSSADPRSEEGYVAVKANLAAALDDIADALQNFESASPAANRAAGWVQDLRRVADDLRVK